MALPFRIFKVQGDGNLHFVEAIQSIYCARQRVRELGDRWPGEYAIENKGIEKRVFVGTTPKKLKGRVKLLEQSDAERMLLAQALDETARKRK